ncbi:C-reactive protein 1.4-like [Centruroides sculpturatus]|uniref:C-reactive protein 1.4-like n=1 Tax=Centruroides sculpturatus TaxID=218467 RepID=UPI000C6E6EEC|nr:C-reactive protein 1.4-like [Centruroides sculpturatus]
MWFPVLCVLLSLALVENSQLKIHIPTSNYEGHYPRLRLDQRFPSLNEFTICSWIKPHSIQREFFTFFSYATLRYDNEFAVCLSNKDGNVKVGVNIAKSYIEMQCPNTEWTVGEWYHLCVSWFNANGHLQVYTNGYRCHNNTNNNTIARGAFIPKGGVFIVGQDQDALDGGYDADQAWFGDIADINMWDEVLTERQIKEAGKCEGKRKKGNVISGLISSMTAFDIYISETELCQP